MDVATAAWAWIGAASLVAFVLAAYDKVAAQSGRSRVPEAALLGAALIGGTAGLIAAMLLVRHKTRKPSFLVALAFVILIQAAMAWWLLL